MATYDIRTGRVKIGMCSGTALPATANPGETFVKTDNPPGSRLYYGLPNGTWEQVTGETGSVGWDDVENKPTEFPPEAHTHLMADITDLETGSIPAGVICMWSGLLANIPSGWALCDGQGGRPDLRSRFIKGAAAAAEPGDTGGAATHSHDYSDVINHTHAVNITDPGHAHTLPSFNHATGNSANKVEATNSTTANSASTGNAATGISATTDAPAGGVSSGTTETASSEPAFFTLAFIIKL